MRNTTFSRVRVLASALATVSTLVTLTEALAQPMGPAHDPRASGYAARGANPGDDAADPRSGPGYGRSARDRRDDRDDRGPPRHRYPGRRARAHPVHPRPECELGLHGCLGRDGLYHGKF